jgi:hypothetical protein
MKPYSFLSPATVLLCASIALAQELQIPPARTPHSNATNKQTPKRSQDTRRNGALGIRLDKWENFYPHQLEKQWRSAGNRTPQHQLDPGERYEVRQNSPLTDVQGVYRLPLRRDEWITDPVGFGVPKLRAHSQGDIFSDVAMVVRAVPADIARLSSIDNSILAPTFANTTIPIAPPIERALTSVPIETVPAPGPRTFSSQQSKALELPSVSSAGVMGQSVLKDVELRLHNDGLVSLVPSPTYPSAKATKVTSSSGPINQILQLPVGLTAKGVTPAKDKVAQPPLSLPTGPASTLAPLQPTPGEKPAGSLPHASLAVPTL